MINEEETIDILYNNCYGGFRISKEALQKYNEKLLKKNPEAEEVKYCFDLRRDDPILVEVFYEMDGENSKQGEGFNGKCAKIEVEKIPKEYKKFYVINEYDGTESVDLEYYRYSMSLLKKIVNDETLTNEERVLKMKDIINKYKYSI